RLRNLHDEACQRAAQRALDASGVPPREETPQTIHAILAGDFNFTPDNPAYGDLQNPLAGNGPRYRDAWPLLNHHQPHPPTFCVHSAEYSKTPYCCDFVFVSDTLAERVRAIEVDSQARESDHQPVLAEIDDH
ncbi:MAG: endonuclease/exonuclease/phosphatase family protein, partial [Usitatibacter sp.]